MTTVRMTTYQDAIDAAVDFLGSDTGGQTLQRAKRAVLTAYRELPAVTRWSFYLCRGHFNTNAPYSTGTIQYQHSGGSYPRLVTLTGGTFPSWAGQGMILFNSNVSYVVASRISNTQLQLTSQSNPGADVAAGATYTLYQDQYALPADFLAADELINTNHILSLQYVHPPSWLARQRIIRTPATPYIYTFLGSQSYMGTMAAAFFPPPDQVYPFDFIYQRRPRQLSVDNYSTGTVSASAGATMVTGSGTAWTSAHVGSVIRVGDTQNVPTGPAGLYPALEERVVAAVASNTSLTVDQALSNTYSGAKYIISDPVDIEEGAMLTAFLRCVEKHVALATRMKERAAIEASFNEALILAMEADSRSFAARVAGDGAYYRYRLAHMPRGPDVS